MKSPCLFPLFLSTTLTPTKGLRFGEQYSYQIAIL